MKNKERCCDLCEMNKITFGTPSKNEIQSCPHKRNKFQSVSSINHRVSYSNKRVLLTEPKSDVVAMIEAWECPDGTGNWFCYSIRIKDKTFYLKKVKIDHEGNVIDFVRYEEK